MKKTKKALASLAIAGMLATMVPFNAFAAYTAPEMGTRLAGITAYDTAQEIAKQTTSADSVVLAAGMTRNSVDALAAGPLAAQLKAPILLTDGSGLLTEQAKAELTRLMPKKVYVTSGTAVVLPAVLDQVKAICGTDSVVALGGFDAYETSLNIAKQMVTLGAKPTGLVIAGGWASPADALSASSIAAAKGMPILAIAKDGMTAAQKAFVATLTSVVNTYVVGGTAVIDEAVLATLPGTVARLAGNTQYDTNLKVLQNFTDVKYDKVFIANGKTFVDALAGTPLAASYGAAIVLADQTVDSSLVTYVKGKMSAASKVIALGGTAAVPESALTQVAYKAPAVLAVSSVSAINATQVQVKFNAAVDAVDGIVLARYQIGGISPASVVLSTDQMTATLTFALATSVEVTNAAVVVNPIQSKDDDLKLSLRHVGLLTFEDVTNPVVSKVESKTNTTVATSVTVTFSEPINTLGTVKIDGVVKTAPTFVAGNTTATFTGLSLTASASHTIQFIGLTDQGANVLALDTQTFAITTDKVAPTATLSASGDHTILVTFDKPMTSATVLAALTAANNYVKDATLSNIAYSNATAVANTDDKQYKIVVTADPFATATTKTLTVVLPSTMTDSLGNAFVGTTQQITFTKDVTAPTISKVTPKVNAAGLVIGFTVSVSEGLKAAAITPSNTNIVIVDSNGVLIPTTGASSLLGGLNAVLPVPVAGDTSFYIPVATPAAKTGVLYFSFAGSLFQDTAFTANNSAAANFTVNFGSATTINTFTLAQGSAVIASNVITVTYANAVKGGGVAGSATTLSNYTLNGSVLPAGTTITLDATQKIATITLPAGSVATSDTGAVFTINNVTQLTGEVIVAFTKPLSVLDNTAPVMNYAVLNADNSITVGFTETVSGIINTDLVVKVNGSTLTTGALVATAGAGLNAGKFVLALDTLVINAAGVTYLDMDGTGTNTPGDLVLATEAAKTTTILGSIATTSVTLGTQAAALTGKDAANNVIKSATSLTVK